jgi:adenylate cyclase
VHALFNTPPDLADHPVKAVHCAIAIPVWTEAYRPAPRAASAARASASRTVTPSSAIGIRTKLDYTAYGEAVNSAGRFDAADEGLGSAICIGPEAASRCPPDQLRPTGTIQLRGFTEAVRKYEPRPADAGAARAALSLPSRQK